MPSIITLTTDFGPGSIYAAVMKGVLLSINPGVCLVDINHAIQPQNLLQTSFTIGAVAGYYPGNTIHLIIVDPGVGTERRAIIARTSQGIFVSPDNGVLSHVLEKAGVTANRHSGAPYTVKLPETVEAFNITNPEHWRLPVSPTFHGRDILAPVAARLSLGLEPAEFGQKTDYVTVLPVPHAHADSEGISGHIQYVDYFGNLVTDIHRNDLGNNNETIEVHIANRIINKLVSTYEESSDDLLALFGSLGFLEIAVRDGSAEKALKAKTGDRISVKKRS